ncbi:MAG TPA: trehalase family glycosidase, partial [Ktedonobacteraceae bacterium]
MNNIYKDLYQQAVEVLQKNWTGTFTKPGALLYHHQWSWDSAFVAIGYAHYDQERAEREMRTLFEGQWSNGMIPHIVFADQADDYFPPPAFWETGRIAMASRSHGTSGIVQPPVHATAILHMYRHAQDVAQARNFLIEAFPHLKAWHEYLYRERDPQGEGLVFIRHPWESQDNSPIWNPVYLHMQLKPEDIPAYTRVDTRNVNAELRPRNEDYDRYAYLVKFFAARDYDEAKIAQDCPFLVQDVLFNALLCQGNRDLAEIACLIGEDPVPFEQMAERTAQTINQKLWNEERGVYIDFDLVTGEYIHKYTAAGFLPLFAGIPDAERARRMYGYLNSISFYSLDEQAYPVPTYDRTEPDFEPSRYWRGPVWINIDWLLYHGLQRYGFVEYAEHIKQTIIELV